jgi:hypothetical protein
VTGGTDVEIVDTRKGWKKIRLDASTEGWTGPICWKRKPSKLASPVAAPGDEGASDSPSQDDGAEAAEPSPSEHPKEAFHDPFAE